MWDDGSALANAGGYGGTAICGATCVPQIANQTRLVNDKSGSFSECVGACMGSFDKAKLKNKRQADGYWFCHGVNFKLGELCEFVGAIQYPSFTGIHLKGSVGTMDLLLADDELCEKFNEAEQSVEEHVEEPVIFNHVTEAIVV